MYYDRKNLGRNKAPRSAGVPYIDTLNLTRSSFHLVEKDFPTLPPPARGKGSSTAALRMDGSHTEREDEKGYGQVADVERAVPAEWA